LDCRGIDVAPNGKKGGAEKTAGREKLNVKKKEMSVRNGAIQKLGYGKG